MVHKILYLKNNEFILLRLFRRYNVYNELEKVETITPNAIAVTSSASQADSLNLGFLFMTEHPPWGYNVKCICMHACRQGHIESVAVMLDCWPADAACHPTELWVYMADCMWHRTAELLMMPCISVADRCREGACMVMVVGQRQPQCNFNFL